MQPSPCDWRSLPADVLSTVAAFSSPGTLAQMRGVCRQWRCSINSNIHRAALHGVTQEGGRQQKPGLQAAPPMPNIYHGIRFLDMSFVEIDLRCLHALADCSDLSSLALQSCSVLVLSLLLALLMKIMLAVYAPALLCCFLLCKRRHLPLAMTHAPRVLLAG